MKKFYNLILVFVISLFIMGCGGNSGDEIHKKNTTNLHLSSVSVDVKKDKLTPIKSEYKGIEVLNFLKTASSIDMEHIIIIDVDSNETCKFTKYTDKVAGRVYQYDSSFEYGEEYDFRTRLEILVNNGHLQILNSRFQKVGFNEALFSQMFFTEKGDGNYFLQIRSSVINSNVIKSEKDVADKFIIKYIKD